MCFSREVEVELDIKNEALRKEMLNENKFKNERFLEIETNMKLLRTMYEQESESRGKTSVVQEAQYEEEKLKKEYMMMISEGRQGNEEVKQKWDSAILKASKLRQEQDAQRETMLKTLELQEKEKVSLLAPLSFYFYSFNVVSLQTEASVRLEDARTKKVISMAKMESEKTIQKVNERMTEMSQSLETLNMKFKNDNLINNQMLLKKMEEMVNHAPCIKEKNVPLNVEQVISLPKLREMINEIKNEDISSSLDSIEESHTVKSMQITISNLQSELNQEKSLRMMLEKRLNRLESYLDLNEEAVHESELDKDSSHILPASSSDNLPNVKSSMPNFDFSSFLDHNQSKGPQTIYEKNVFDGIFPAFPTQNI